MQFKKFNKFKLGNLNNSGQALVEYAFLAAIFGGAVLIAFASLAYEASDYYEEQTAQLMHMQATVEAYQECTATGKTAAECSDIPDEEEETEVVDNPDDNAPACIQINPGNKDDWEFCAVTPSGTYNRSTLKNDPNFAYSGLASSLYFKPTAGGGEALVNGEAFTVSSGPYYLFEGNVNINLSSAHPGSMGQWAVCIDTDALPTSGNGNKRPVSPCE